MMLEALSSNDLLNFLLYETLSPAQFNTSFEFPENEDVVISHNDTISSVNQESPPEETTELAAASMVASGRGRKRRRRKPRVCKNKEEAETQRMTHITVERNRRKQMNQHLSALRSLMPQSYTQKGDQASIVGGAIDFIKELEHHLQILESQKLQRNLSNLHKFTSSSTTLIQEHENPPPPSLSRFFLHSYDQYNTKHINPETKHSSKSSMRAAMEDIDVTLIETHANIRILSRRRRSLRRRERSTATSRLLKLVAALHSLSLSVLHLSLTTMNNTSTIYSISTKVEESCELSSVDEIAGAVHHMLCSVIDEEESSIP